MSRHFHHLLSTKMTRKEFLVYLGIFFITLTGIAGLIKSLTTIDVSGRFKPKKGLPAQTGFGSGPYGV